MIQQIIKNHIYTQQALTGQDYNLSKLHALPSEIVQNLQKAFLFFIL